MASPAAPLAATPIGCIAAGDSADICVIFANLSFNSRTSRSADFLPMPGNFVNCCTCPLITANLKASGVMPDKMPSPTLGPIPETEMSKINNSYSSSVQKP